MGSSVELRYHVEKAPCTDLRSDPTLLQKFLQNYAGGRVRQPRTPNTSAERKFPKPNYTKAIPCQKDCFTLDSHMLTSSSFFSLQTQHDQSRGNTNTTNKTKPGKQRRRNRERCVPCVGLSYVKLCDTAALVH